MNYSTAVLLINTDCRAVYGIYAPDPNDEKLPKEKRELFKTFDTSIAVGDIVMVPSNTRHNVTTVKITDVDVEWDINVRGDVRWIIGKVDQGEYQRLRDQEAAAIVAIKESEKTAARNKLKAQMFAHMDTEAVKKLAIAGSSPDVAGIGAKPLAAPAIDPDTDDPKF